MVVQALARSLPSRADLETLADSGAGFSAALCYNDIVALGFGLGLRDRGLLPGRDVAVVGFDNLPESEAWSPGLTTVESFPRTIGMESARLLLRRLDDPEAPPASIRMPPRLIERASSALCERASTRT